MWVIILLQFDYLKNYYSFNYYYLLGTKTTTTGAECVHHEECTVEQKTTRIGALFVNIDNQVAVPRFNDWGYINLFRRI